MSLALMGSIAINVILYPIFSVSIRFLWNLLVALQIIVNLNIIDVVYPYQLTVLFETLINISNFKIIPTDYIVSAYKDWINQNFVDDTDSNGYSSSSLILNLSTIIIFLIAAIILLLLCTLVIRIGTRV